MKSPTSDNSPERKVKAIKNEIFRHGTENESMHDKLFLDSSFGRRPRKQPRVIQKLSDNTLDKIRKKIANDYQRSTFAKKRDVPLTSL